MLKFSKLLTCMCLLCLSACVSTERNVNSTDHNRLTVSIWTDSDDGLSNRFASGVDALLEEFFHFTTLPEPQKDTLIVRLSVRPIDNRFFGFKAEIHRPDGNENLELDNCEQADLTKCQADLARWINKQAT